MYWAAIRENREVIPGHFLLTLRITGEYPSPVPGQFVMIRLGGTSDPLLRRPFSVHRFHKERTGALLTILYQVIGRGTEIMSRFHRDEIIRISAPLGVGFHVPVQWKRLYLVAGGIGVAPLLFLAETCRKREKGGEIVGYLGAKSQNALLALDDMETWCSYVHIATDDGSYGICGTVTAAVKADLPHIPDDETAIYACGPRDMIRELAAMLSARSIFCQVSLEERMACGVGACLGCVVSLKNRMGKPYYGRVCTDGPVFNIRHVIWEE